MLTAVRIASENRDYWLLGINDRTVGLPEPEREAPTLGMEDGEKPNTITARVADPGSQISFTLDRFLSEEGPWSSFTVDQKS
jgi:hypothetical protein